MYARVPSRLLQGVSGVMLSLTCRLACGVQQMQHSTSVVPSSLASLSFHAVPPPRSLLGCVFVGVLVSVPLSRVTCLDCGNAIAPCHAAKAYISNASGHRPRNSAALLIYRMVWCFVTCRKKTSVLCHACRLTQMQIAAAAAAAKAKAAAPQPQQAPRS